MSERKISECQIPADYLIYRLTLKFKENMIQLNDKLALITIQDLFNLNAFHGNTLHRKKSNRDRK